MGMFRYQGMAQGGEAMGGTVEADSPARAEQLLTDMGIKLYSLEPAPKEPARTRLGRTEFLLFNQQLASITKAGLPLEKALRQVAGDVQSGRLRRAINELATDLEAGMSLDAAFARHERSFPYLYGRIIKAGVQSGRLGEMLASLNRHLEMAGQTRRLVLDAVTYPLLVLVLASIVITGLLVYVVPQYRTIFDDLFSGLGTERPRGWAWMTEALFWVSDHVVRLWVVLGCMVGGLVGLRVILGASQVGRRWWERQVIGLPALGKLYHRTHLARLADALAILVGAGCELPAALRLAGGASGSPNLLAECELMAQATEAGQGLDAQLLGTRYVPAMMLYSMRVGAQRNDLESNLYSLSEMYAGQARHLQANLQALLLPILILVLGVLIALAIMGLMAPLIDLIRPYTVLSKF